MRNESDAWTSPSVKNIGRRLDSCECGSELPVYMNGWNLRSDEWPFLTTGAAVYRQQRDGEVD